MYDFLSQLHWHRVAEWGYVLSGDVRVSAVDENGRNTLQTAHKGDLRYFPKSVPHSLQGLENSAEYLLTFDDGNFDAPGTTFMVTD